MIRKLWKNESFKAVLVLLGLVLLLFVFVYTMRMNSKPHDQGEPLRYSNSGLPFPYAEEEKHVRNYGPSDEPRPSSPPIPDWMHSEMVYVSKVQESEALKFAYTPNELLTFGIVTCRGDVELHKVRLLVEDVNWINQNAQEYLCKFYK